jgi:hypothetical protein
MFLVTHFRVVIRDQLRLPVSAHIQSEWDNTFQNNNPLAVLGTGAQSISAMIATAVNDSTPLYRPSPRAKVWWTDKLPELRKYMNPDLGHWKRNRCDLSWITYKNRRNKYFEAIREPKTESWTTFLENCKGKDVFKGLKYIKTNR